MSSSEGPRASLGQQSTIQYKYNRIANYILTTVGAVYFAVLPARELTVSRLSVESKDIRILLSIK